MKRTLPVLAILLLLVTASVLLGANSLSARNTVQAAGRNTVQSAGRSDDQTLTSSDSVGDDSQIYDPKTLLIDLRQAKEEFEQQRDELYAQLAKAGPTERRLGLQRELERVKITAELRYLKIQLRHARLRGNTQLTAQLQEMVDGVSKWIETQGHDSAGK